jgi:hypothetical protein
MSKIEKRIETLENILQNFKYFNTGSHVLMRLINYGVNMVSYIIMLL